MNILYLISYYDISDGSSNAVFSQLKIDQKLHGDYLVCCRWKKKVQKDTNIIECTDIDVLSDFLKREGLIIHYFKAITSDILDRVVSMLRKLEIRNVPILMTVCQSPSFPPYLLSPFEIHNVSHFVFIDKTAYADKVHSFIPIQYTSLIRLASVSPERMIRTDISTTNKDKSKVVFGRGSTLSKCPRNMFEVFDKIDVPNKFFYVVGIPKGDNWVRKEAEQRTNVAVYDIMPREEWETLCSSFDVFLYHLPNICHASLDGNISTAMLLRIPVVYMGCDAPKERFLNGQNGFVANDVDEMAYYATLLGSNEELRKRIGEEGRSSTIRMFPMSAREEGFTKLYSQISKPVNIHIPLSYYFLYFRSCYKEIIKKLLNWYSRKPF